MKKQTAAAAVKGAEISGFTTASQMWLRPIEDGGGGWRFREATYTDASGQVVNVYIQQPAIGPGTIRMSSTLRYEFRQMQMDFSDPVNLSRESLRRAAKAFADRVRKE